MSLFFEELHLQHFDPDELLHVLNSMEMEHRLLAGGALSAHWERLTLGDLGITAGDYSFPVLVRGGTPHDGKVYLGLLGRVIDEVRVNTNLVPMNQLVLYAPGCEIHYHTRADSNWFMLQFPLEALQSLAIAQQGVDLDWPRQGVRYVDLASKIFKRLLRELRGLLQLGRQLVDPPNADVTESLLYEGVMQLLVEAIVQGSCSSAARLSAGRKRALTALESSIDRWMGNPDNNFRVSDIEGISQRLLEMASREVYGATPHRWFKLARLNSAYSDLCSGSSTSVTDVCLKLGFGHMGRFAGEYRELFGESPRETLRKNNN